MFLKTATFIYIIAIIMVIIKEENHEHNDIHTRYHEGQASGIRL